MKQKSNDIELEASAFAVLLLIPKKLLTVALDEIKIDLADDKSRGLKELCKRFDVSSTSMVYRLSLMKRYGV